MNPNPFILADKNLSVEELKQLENCEELIDSLEESKIENFKFYFQKIATKLY